MLSRPRATAELMTALARSPIVLLVGARQVGKTTLARTITRRGSAEYFDLEDPVDLARLEQPMLALDGLRGTIVIDEVQRRPDLFPILRVLADREDSSARFLVLGSASPEALRQASESLAGRVEVIELSGIGAEDVADNTDELWLRGGYPRSFLAASAGDSLRWRESYIRTLAGRDLQDFGMGLPPATIERFLGLVAHTHGNLWNSAAIARALGINETTARKYVDGLADAMLVRVLQPWHVNSGKRLVRSPKVYYRDTGLLHALWGGVNTQEALLRHIGVGASWESFVLEEAIRRAPTARPYFWRTSNGAELDLLLDGTPRIGIEVKRADAPRLTASMRAALDELKLDELFVVYPGTRRYRLAERATVVPFSDLVAAQTIDDLSSE
ncbi:ATP-binding protein [Tessaracoccus caeni]|uniref:ATP-binding protein n=1 Tax=Tessaracoccus caeni TaxID=3031239 RepID=UPI0023D9CAA6|nr:ATP-binding protein [Tessaracoccus caeni]MDF1489347.1 ATP-binding protein [Tessaracoccus caeni]